jgi:hypothetical protein
MPRGAKPGERRGGRSRGTPNRATIERTKRAELEMAEAKAAGRKLCKDLLEDFAFQFADLASFYRSRNDLREYERWSLHAVSAAKEAARYQSPQLRSVEVLPTPPAERVRRFTLTVFDTKPLDGTLPR